MTHPSRAPATPGVTAHHKTDPTAPPGFFAVEAAGLTWLSAAHAHGGVRTARVLHVDDAGIAVERQSIGPPTHAHAEGFGRALAATHRVGAAWHGCPPGPWRLDGFIGTLPLPHVRPGVPPVPWATFYAQYRIAPYLRAARDQAAIGSSEATAIERVCERLTDGDPALVGPSPDPARIHGDLWSGNVVWTPHGVVLIDPAAHGGHRETDLAMLALFGLPLLDRVLAAYDETWPLDGGWRDRVGLHQLHPLLVHAVLFGGGYGRQAAAVARRYA